MLPVRAGTAAERLASTEDGELAVLQSREIAFRGQLVGVAVAETSELARQAADVVRLTYAEQAHDTELRADRDDLYRPEKVNPSHEPDTAEGDVAAAMAGAAVTVEETYSTAMYHNNPLEPHATTALWQDGSLTLWDSTQGVHPARAAVAKVFGLDEDRVRVVCPYVGGGFGSKGQPHANVILAAMAARAVPGRPVKLALTRGGAVRLGRPAAAAAPRRTLARGHRGRVLGLPDHADGRLHRAGALRARALCRGDRRRRPRHRHLDHPAADRRGRARRLGRGRRGPDRGHPLPDRVGGRRLLRPGHLGVGRGAGRPRVPGQVRPRPRRRGRGHHITVNADVGDIQAHWLDEHDPYVNVMGTKGIGEIGITGTAAAVVNAAYRATGVRVRDLPLTLDKVLPGLP